jgi:hypothetical protein
VITSSEIKTRSFFGIKFNAENIVLFSCILFTLIIGLLPISYGFWRDELYYIALSKHLAWGYVDVPPLMPFCIAIMRFLFGESAFAMHFIPAIFSAIILVLTREIVKKLGGSLFAQILALLCMMMAPVFFYHSSNLTYDCFDHLFWAFCLYFLVQLLTTENKKYWLYIGAFAGLGLMAKFGMLWLIFGVVVAMPFTKERKYFCCWQFWIGGLIALVILSPHLVWITQHQFLTFEYLRNYAQNTAQLTFSNFLLEQIKAENLLSFPVWMLGLYYFLFNAEGKKFRLFGLAYIFIFILCLVQQSKYYMILPIFPVLFAGGAVFIEKIAHRFRSIYFISAGYLFFIVIVGLLVLPACRPIFQVDFLIKYLNYMHMFRSGEKMATEKYNLGLLPQGVADSFGWQEMTAQIAKIYYALPEKERSKTVIVTGNYGEASGIYFYGEKYKLPMPISQHLQYYVWGYQNLDTNGTVIVIGSDLADQQRHCKTVKQVGQTYNKYAVPYENKPIFLCRGLKKPIQQIWEEGKNMHM